MYIVIPTRNADSVKLETKHNLYLRGISCPEALIVHTVFITNVTFSGGLINLAPPGSIVMVGAQWLPSSHVAISDFSPASGFL